MLLQNQTPWTKLETEYCYKLYPNYDMLEKKLPTRSPSAIRSQCKRLGLSKGRHKWSHEEMEHHPRLFPKTPWVALCKALPFATRNMIQSMASSQGLSRSIENKPVK